MAHAIAPGEVRRDRGRCGFASADPRRVGDARAPARPQAAGFRAGRHRRDRRGDARSRWCCNIPARPARSAPLHEEINAAHEAGALAIVARGSAVARPADAARRDGRGRGRRLRAAVRRADGLRRSARGLFRDQGRLQAANAGPTGRRERGRGGCARDAAGLADARAAHQAREGDLQHLHRAGAAGCDRRHVCGLARGGGDQENRPAREPASATVGRRRRTRRT